MHKRIIRYRNSGGPLHVGNRLVSAVLFPPNNRTNDRRGCRYHVGLAPRIIEPNAAPVRVGPHNQHRMRPRRGNDYAPTVPEGAAVMMKNERTISSELLNYHVLTWRPVADVQFGAAGICQAYPPQVLPLRIPVRRYGLRHSEISSTGDPKVFSA